MGGGGGGGGRKRRGRGEKKKGKGGKNLLVFQLSTPCFISLFLVGGGGGGVCLTPTVRGMGMRDSNQNVQMIHRSHP